MDCREFREQHLSYVDDTLPGIELVRMQMHLTECPECSRHDATIRRSLMLFRSLPRIEPSPDFSQKLERKLRDARVADAAALHTGRTRRLGAAVTVSSALMLAYIGLSLRQVDTPQDIVLPPVVALAISTEVQPSSGPALEMIAAVPAGLPLWTAALYAEQTPVHFASIESTSAR
ncbi:MAG TPA: zf-HC2 domain-containing protein [Gemmatimonadaceae bacterium]|jgi:anti-sigma factor RsiW|nr:zf-HC2 domain-containing protein [Gemmatimonadaceae bacterium]